MTNKNNQMESHVLELELNTEDTQAKVMQLIPPPNADGEIKGRDGRIFKADIKAIANFHHNDPKDIRIDLEHYSERGGDTSAEGWIKNVFIGEDGGLYGDYELIGYTDDIVNNKRIRYTSPVFSVNQKTREIKYISSVGLTNEPNLYIKALNKPQPQESNMTSQNPEQPQTQSTPQETTKEFNKDELLEELRKEFNKKIADQEKKFNEELNSVKAETLKKELNTRVETAIENGKLLPSHKEWALTLELNQLDEFLALSNNNIAKELNKQQSDNPPDKPQADEELSEVQREVNKAMGLDDENDNPQNNQDQALEK